MTATPLIGDIDVERYQFQPGDRLLVRVAYDLNPDQQHKLYRSICRFTGEDVRILIANCMKMRMLKVTQSGSTEIVLIEKLGDNYRIPKLLKGEMELKCSVVDLRAGDLLSVQLKEFPEGNLQQGRVIDWLRQWTGDDVEIRLMRWV